ncbi:hypothetical protein ACWD6S_37505, partial [Streptomyces zhihengii]
MPPPRAPVHAEAGRLGASNPHEDGPADLRLVPPAVAAWAAAALALGAPGGWTAAGVAGCLLGAVVLLLGSRRSTRDGSGSRPHRRSTRDGSGSRPHRRSTRDGTGARPHRRSTRDGTGPRPTRPPAPDAVAPRRPAPDGREALAASGPTACPQPT